MFLDLKIGFDPALRRCDLVYDGRRLVLDTTPVTPMLISLGSDRRAEPDDTLPDGTTEGSLQAGFNPRRGWPGDAFGGGARIGSRLWLYDRDKLTAELLQAVEDAATEALAWLPDAHGSDSGGAEVEVAASKAGHDALLLDVLAGGARQQFRLKAGV